jgi:hypothetical protein
MIKGFLDYQDETGYPVNLKPVNPPKNFSGQVQMTDYSKVGVLI